MALKLLQLLCYIFYACVSVLLIIGLTLFVLQLNNTSFSCGFANNEIIDIVSLENNKDVTKQIQNQTQADIEFTGKYQMIKSENFDTYLEELGVGFLQRTVANKASAEYEITRNKDVYTLRTISPFKTTEITFKLNGEEFDETRLDGLRVKSSVVQKDNKWIQTQVGDNKEIRIVREFVNDLIKVTGSVNNVSFVRIYKKIK